MDQPQHPPRYHLSFNVRQKWNRVAHTDSKRRKLDEISPREHLQRAQPKPK